jgi:hypothetical protein
MTTIRARQQKDRSSIPRRSKISMPPPICRDKDLSSSLLFYGHHRLLSGGKAAGAWIWPLSPFRAEIKNEWNCICTQSRVFMAHAESSFLNCNIGNMRQIQKFQIKFEMTWYSTKILKFISVMFRSPLLRNVIPNFIYLFGPHPVSPRCLNVTIKHLWAFKTAFTHKGHVARMGERCIQGFSGEIWRKETT